MRDILFRAKRIDNGKWVYGYYIKTHDYLDNREIHLIIGIDSTAFPANEITDTNEVNLETLGQYTGLTDKNGMRIFEGDIVNYFGKDFLNCLVTFDKGSFWFEFLSEYTRKIRNQKRDLIFSNVSVCGEVIGNVYDDPELLEENNNG